MSTSFCCLSHKRTPREIRSTKASLRHQTASPNITSGSSTLSILHLSSGPSTPPILALQIHRSSQWINSYRNDQATNTRDSHKLSRLSHRSDSIRLPNLAQRTHSSALTVITYRKLRPSTHERQQIATSSNHRRPTKTSRTTVSYLSLRQAVAVHKLPVPPWPALFWAFI
jgi:hypothetical protein